jgi:hypothetical protein
MAPQAFARLCGNSSEQNRLADLNEAANVDGLFFLRPLLHRLADDGNPIRVDARPLCFLEHLIDDFAVGVIALIKTAKGGTEHRGANSKPFRI